MIVFAVFRVVHTNCSLVAAFKYAWEARRYVRAQRERNGLPGILYFYLRLESDPGEKTNK